MDNLEQLAKDAMALKNEYLHLYELDQNKEARSKELEYLNMRKTVLSSIDENIVRQKSIPIRQIRQRVESKPKIKRIETGIRSLDMELVSDSMKMRGISGGMALGNFVQIAGGKGVGKSSIMLSILTGFSNYEKVCWFDFEMGEDRVIQKLKDFKHNEDNMLYYAASRQLDDVVDEIKFLNASGVNHFVIDSAMKINVKSGDRYEKFSTISGRLSELTSSLGINIYMINQMSQSADGEGRLNIKHGNDAEYDADFIFFIVKVYVKDQHGKNITDESGDNVIDQENRLIICEKNRQDERLFKVLVPKYEIIKSVVEIEYEEGA